MFLNYYINLIFKRRFRITCCVCLLLRDAGLFFQSPGYPSPRPPTGQSTVSAARRAGGGSGGWPHHSAMSLCDNPLEPFLHNYPTASGGVSEQGIPRGFSTGADYPVVGGISEYTRGGGGISDYQRGGYSGYPCDIYENPSEHYATLGSALHYPSRHDTDEEAAEEERRPMAAQYFNHGECCCKKMQIFYLDEWRFGNYAILSCRFSFKIANICNTTVSP